MTREDVIREFETRHPIYACRREMADEIMKLRAQLAVVRELATSFRAVPSVYLLAALEGANG